MSTRNNPEAERAAIGCAIQDANLAPELHPDWFDDLRHRKIAETLLRMSQEGKAIDLATVAQETSSKGPDMIALVSQCIDASPSPANWRYWRDRLTDALTVRSVHKVAQNVIYEAERGEQEPAALLEMLERDALAIRRSLTGGGQDEVDLKSVLSELTDEWDAAKTEGKPRGLPTGFIDLDRLLGGLKPQQLFILAARPSVGKTSLALNIAERVAVDDRLPVAFYSLEMSGKELGHRLACSRGRVDGTALNEGRPEDVNMQALAVAMGKIRQAPLHICDRGGLTIPQLTAHVRRMVQRHGVKLVIVDYLGLLRSGEKGRSRYEETTLVSQGLKSIAKECNLPVIALSQLNRASEKEARPPRLSDLRDSGSIEQDADIVGLLHRDEDDIGRIQKVSLYVAKHRNGRTGKVPLIFRREFTRFESGSI